MKKLYYTKEVVKDVKWIKSAGSKARVDVEHILKSCGCKEFEVEIINEEKMSRIKRRMAIEEKWKNKMCKLNKGDILLIQYPLVCQSYTLSFWIKEARKKGVTVGALIHDSSILRESNMTSLSRLYRHVIVENEKTIFGNLDFMIVHNEKMKEKMEKMKFIKAKLLTLEIFDYLHDMDDKLNESNKNEPIVIAGALYKEKCGYIYELPDSMKFNIYGVGFEKKYCKNKNVDYKGAFEPNILPYKLEGAFGLIWDGPCKNSCTGVFGDYLKVNNPHKTSLYLSCGIPVIIWKDAALSSFVRENKCGFVINSIDDIPNIINRLSDEEYEIMKNNAIKIGKKLKSGYYTKKVLKEIYC